MLGTKYLGEIIREEGLEFDSNTMIVAPVGSGKTYYILNDLCVKHRRVLYLCDNGNLKFQVEKDSDRAGIKDMICRFDVLSYKAFGIKVKNDTLNKFINKYDIIICDEVHNLLDYQSFNNDGDLLVTRVKLFRKYEYTKIIFFTATPYYLDRLAEDNENLGHYFVTYDFTKHPNINRYIERRKAFINHISQVQFQLDQYEQSFKYRNLKCLMYTSNISDMKFLEEMCISRNLKPICIWSTNAKEDMSEEQLKVRAYLLETGKLLDGYNCLIINRATETGVNIIDEDMNLIIVNTTNYTQQVQARGRVRHDVDLLVVKTHDNKQIELALEIDEKLLNIDLLKTDVEDKIIYAYGIRDEKHRLYSVKKLGNALEPKGYKIETRKKTYTDKETKKRKQITFYRITKVD